LATRSAVNLDVYLRAYVQRAFELKTEENAKVLQDKITALVKQAQEGNMVWDVDWDDMELPK
jgi:hypothetical protein